MGAAPGAAAGPCLPLTTLPGPGVCEVHACVCVSKEGGYQESVLLTYNLSTM